MTETLKDDAAAVRFPPPLVYLIAVIGGALLEYLLLPLPLVLSLPLRVALSGLAALAGFALIRGAIGHFRRTGQDPIPWKSTPEIISTGIYRFTRNPMYLGMASIQLCIGIAFGSGWIVALVPVSLLVVYAIAVRHEETYLEQKFGEVYTRYKASVRRWL
jgi:protein-S-isoprenylcysteine O-methyltransferase Ste14